MDLILWRHAEAEDPRPGLPDERRRLTPKGEKQARKMAKWLKKRLPKNTRILVSPTERTRMTAHALGLPFEIDQRIGPGASADDLLTLLDSAGSLSSLLIVGHQPTLGQIASRVLCARRDADGWPLKKGALCWLAWRNAGEAEALAMMTPDLI